MRGAWIEMSYWTLSHAFISSLPVRGAWIEIFPNHQDCGASLSLPVRGAWIEITIISCVWRAMLVAPRAGSVD